jgi:hypothetical protein
VTAEQSTAGNAFGTTRALFIGMTGLPPGEFYC